MSDRLQHLRLTQKWRVMPEESLAREYLRRGGVSTVRYEFEVAKANAMIRAEAYKKSPTSIGLLWLLYYTREALALHIALREMS